MAKNMEAPFVFGVRVEGDAFTDRREETERLKANFTYGVSLTESSVHLSCSTYWFTIH